MGPAAGLKGSRTLGEVGAGGVFARHCHCLSGVTFLLVKRERHDRKSQQAADPRGKAEVSIQTWILLAKLVFWGYKHACGCRSRAPWPASDRRGGVQDHRVVVRGRGAARRLPLQVMVVAGEAAPAHGAVPAAGVAQPRLLALAGRPQAEGRKRRVSAIEFLKSNPKIPLSSCVTCLSLSES